MVRTKLCGGSVIWWSSFYFRKLPYCFFENLVDLNQPYSCETWGEFGDIGIPILTYDENNDNFFNFFGNQFTWSVILSPDMVVQYSGTGTITSDIIQNILDEYELLGDQNYDGLVNILDIIQMVHFILEEEYTFIGDLNNDGGINILDIIALVDLILDN